MYNALKKYLPSIGKKDEDTMKDLCCAVEERNLEKVKKIISDYSLSYSNASTDLLCEALENKDTEIIKLYVTSGCKVNYDSKMLCDTPLHIAVTNGNMGILKMLLEKGANTDTVNKENKTPLSSAVKLHSSEMVKLMYSYRTNVSDNVGTTSFLILDAVNGEDADILKYILSYDSNAFVLENAMLVNSYKPIHDAFKQNPADMAKLSSKYGIDGDIQKIYGIPPKYILVENPDLRKLFLTDKENQMFSLEVLKTAILTENLDILKTVLKFNIDVNNYDKYGISALHYALLDEVESCNNLEIVKSLLNKGANVNATSIHGCTALQKAIKNVREDLVKVLLEYNADTSFNDGSTALHICASTGYANIAKLLLEHCDDIEKNFDGYTPLHVAVTHGYDKVVEVLLEYNANVNCVGKFDVTALHSAVLVSATIAEMLLKNGADPNFAPSGVPPIDSAILSGNKDIVEILLKYGARVDYKGNKINCFCTSLHTAASKGHDEIIELILTFGIDVDGTDSKGSTPLQYAVHGGYEKSIEIFLSRQADVNHKNTAGLTPLHYAVAHRNKAITEMLLNKGADANAVANNGTSVFCHAVTYGSNEVVEVLLQYNARNEANAANHMPSNNNNHVENIFHALLRSRANKQNTRH